MEQQTQQQPSGTLPTEVTYSYAAVDVTFKTRESQQMHYRVIEPMNSALLWIEVGMGKIENEMLNLADITNGELKESIIYSEIIEYFEQRITDLATEFDEELTKLSGLESKAKFNLKTNTKNPRIHEVQAKSPLTLSFLSLVAQFDEIVEQATRLNFAGVLDRRQRVEMVRDCEYKLTKLGRLVIDTNKEANKRIKRIKREARRRAAADASAKEQKKQEQAQGNKGKKSPAKQPQKQARQPAAVPVAEPQKKPEKTEGDTVAA